MGFLKIICEHSSQNIRLENGTELPSRNFCLK